MDQKGDGKNLMSHRKSPWMFKIYNGYRNQYKHLQAAELLLKHKKLEYMFRDTISIRAAIHGKYAVYELKKPESEFYGPLHITPIKKKDFYVYQQLRDLFNEAESKAREVMRGWEDV